RAGTKDVAEFWINFKGRMIHIRYFAIRDKDKKYRGVIEMSQDITDIQKLEGQQRLLDWD
ncbi:MAG TPA: PAS domain-containing protein, partial [Vicingus sp.]|nr:PAS domain-containing protein [Vicingus sp.]